MGDPARLDLDNPEVAEADKLFEIWNLQRETEISGDEDAELRHKFEKTMFYVDAGFHDRDYLEEVLHDWLIANDIDEMPKDKENPARVQLRKDMAKAILHIRALLRA